jgi:hypothetical protein
MEHIQGNSFSDTSSPPIILLLLRPQPGKLCRFQENLIAMYWIIDVLLPLVLYSKDGSCSIVSGVVVWVMVVVVVIVVRIVVGVEVEIDVEVDVVEVVVVKVVLVVVDAVVDSN